MTARPTPPAASDSAAIAAAEQARLALRERHMATLDDLIDAGMGMVKALAAQVAGTGPQVVEGDVALAYSRFSRAVRLSILLQSRLLEDPAEAAPAKARSGQSGRDHDGEPEEIFVTWLEPEESKRQGRRERVAQIVERMARGDGESEDTVERLYREAVERLEDVHVYGDLAFRPVSEVLAEICRDLGLKPDWAVLATHPWARQEIEKGQKGEEEVGWPLKGGPPPPDGWRGRWPPGPGAEEWRRYGNPWPSKRRAASTLDEVDSGRFGQGREHADTG